MGDRINLAKALTAQVKVNADGTVTVTNYADDTARGVATASSISVGGTAIDGFDPATRTYVVDWPAGRDLPAVTARPTVEGATATVVQPLLPRLKTSATGAGAADRTRTISVTSADGKSTTSYTVVFWITADSGTPGGGGTDPGNGGTNPGGNNPGGSAPGGGSDPGSSGAWSSPNGGSSAAVTGGALADTGGSDVGSAALGAAFLILLGVAATMRRAGRRRKARTTAS